MNTFSIGQSSSSNFFVQFFLNIQNIDLEKHEPKTFSLHSIARFSLAFVLLFCLALPLFAATPYAELPPANKDLNTWPVEVKLNCVLSDAADVSHVSLFTGAAGFTGCSDDLVVQADGQTLIYSLSGPSSTLPPNANVALITVTDSYCGGTRQFLVKVDGGGSILILDSL